MKKTLIFLLVVLFVLVAFGRPAFSAVFDDQCVSTVSFELVPVALPGESFAISLALPVFIKEYVEQRKTVRYFEEYYLVDQQRPPPVMG
ncbi:MAG: hypothetical protein HQL17_03180 [Candidatus Omnitrophica bacterium]|nr:hypothetical protein [Candidatus Omnitrophota bacterium]